MSRDQQAASPADRQVTGESRRGFLAQSLTGAGLWRAGLGGLALRSLLAREGLAVDTTPSVAGSRAGRPVDPLGAPDPGPHFAPRAQRVIWIFLRGGLSHLESFDPKPAVTQYAGKTISETPWKHVQDPERLKKVRVVVVNDANGQQRNTLYPLQVGFRKCGQSGLDISEWFPHLGGVADDLAIVRSMWTTDDNHGAQVQFHSGRHMLDARVPTIGGWISYGLGSANDDLPHFVNMGPRFFDVRDGHYLGPAHDAIPLKVDPQNPLAYARPELAVSAEDQRAEFELVGRLGRLKQRRYPDDLALAARIRSYELAFRMQTAVPEVMRLEDESEATRSLYGLDQDVTRPFGMQLLCARRLCERGVRFVQLMHGDGAAGAWDAHSNLKDNHSKLAAQVDRPVAGLLRDLRQRGLLDETIVVFATEFGRTPGSQSGNGRDHHPYGFSICLAGGGIRGGIVHGATDELGFHAVEHPHYVTDVHATLMHLLGVDARRLEVPGQKRLDIDYGEPIHEILS